MAHPSPISAIALAIALAAAPAVAAEPVGAASFNVKATIDLKALSQPTFVALVEPAAKAETARPLVFYDFADTLCDLMTAESARFSKETGIPVKHVCAEGDAATQQIIAAVGTGRPAPMDVFFGPNNAMRALTAAKAIANLDLVDLLPNAAHLDPEAARRSRGFTHGGTVVPFHRNQTVIAYDSAAVAAPPDTLSALFDYAKAHQLKVAVTNPTKGGSGSGFLETAMLALSPDCAKDLYDFSLDEAAAKAVAARCMAPVVAFFNDRKALIDYTGSNENSLQALANKTATFATVWEDDLYTLASKGMVPKTVRPFLLATGEVGDGDGFFITASTDKLEAALLFADFLMSDAVQIKKLEDTGSRTARRDLATAGRIPDKLAFFLVPDAEYQQRTRPRINGLISDAAADLFVEQVIAR
jgi:multiple sugar transport system substrate-binding protein/putative spermidine/putrescine transport system substrate-binding protein